MHRGPRGPAGDRTRSLIGQWPGGRFGTPDDIAAAVAFLSSAEASFISGTDQLVDGGLGHLRNWRDRPERGAGARETAAPASASPPAASI